MWRAREADPGPGPGPGPAAAAPAANFLVDDVVVRYSDGPALMVNGVGTTIRDSPVAPELYVSLALGG